MIITMKRSVLSFMSKNTTKLLHLHSIKPLDQHCSCRLHKQNIKSLTTMPTEMPHFLIVGLGNHGHPGTRHSIGHRAADLLANRFSLEWRKNPNPGPGYVCSTCVPYPRPRQEDQDEMLHHTESCKLTLFKPKALMNVSGVNVAKIATHLRIPAANVYLIHDELERAVGKFQLKEGGSAGGHNGVLSCSSCLRSKDMPRLRIGIGRPACKTMVIPYVLGQFKPEELTEIDAILDPALDALLKHIGKRAEVASCNVS